MADYSLGIIPRLKNNPFLGLFFDQDGKLNLTGDSVRFDHSHASGKWDRPDHEWKQRIERLQQTCKILTLTETTRASLAGALSANREWDYARPDTYRENTVMWDRTFAHAVDVSALKLSNKVPHTGGGAPRPFNATRVALVTEKAAKKIVVFALHAPSDNDKGFRKEVLHDGIRTLVKEIAQTRRNNPNAAILVTGDFNENFRSGRDIAFVSQNLGTQGLKTAWRQPLPIHGTHGTAIIDGSYYRGMTLTTPSHIITGDRGFDHQPFRTGYRL